MRKRNRWDVSAATATVLLAVIAAIGVDRGAVAEPQTQLLPARAKVASQPKYLCDPARLGADETATSRHFQIVDFNGDGLPDLFQISYGPDRSWLILNRGSAGRPYLDRPSRFPCNFSDLRGNPLNTTDAWAVDFDGDGDLDLVIATTSGKLVLAVNEGDRGWPVFKEGKLLVDKLPGGTLCAADADNDGRPDLFVQPKSGGLELYRNTSDIQSASVGPSIPVKDSAGNLVVAPNPSAVEFDGDGVLDLVTSVPSGGVHLHRGIKDDKGEVFQPANPAVDEARKPIAGGNKVAIFDWDGDGMLDLLILDDSCEIRCHAGLKKGAPTFSGRATPVHGNTFGRAEERYAPTLADIDKDGRSDLILGGGYDVGCGGGDPKLRLYRNTLTTGPRAFGAGTFVTGAKDHLQLRPVGYYESGEPCLTDFDGDGRLDLLSGIIGRAGEPVMFDASVMLYSGAGAAPREFKSTVGKLATMSLDNKPLCLRPLAADWNGDGASDLLVGSYAYNLNRLSLLVNRGSSQAPKFEGPVILTAAGQELKGTHPGVGYPCIFDWDGDGRPDLLLSGHLEPGKESSDTTLRWYRNNDGSANLDAPVELKIGPHGKRIPFVGRPAAGDIDGDGVADLVVSRNGQRGHMDLAYGELWWFRGVPSDAPDPVNDLTVVAASANSVTLTWTHSATAEVRCSTQPIDEANWFTARPAAKKPSPAGDGIQKVEFDGLEPGVSYYFAVCMIGAKGGRSGVSNNALGVTRPMVSVALAQGQPARALGLASYSGCVSVQVPGKAGQGLGVKAGEEGWGAYQSYLKFDLKTLVGRKVRKAWVTLNATDATPTEWTIRCREVRSVWDAATISSTTKEGATAWMDSDYGPSLAEISPHELTGVKCWEATELVQGRLKSGDPLLSLHFSTFLTKQTFRFADAASKDPALRPVLTVLLEENDNGR